MPSKTLEMLSPYMAFSATVHGCKFCGLQLPADRFGPSDFLRHILLDANASAAHEAHGSAFDYAQLLVWGITICKMQPGPGAGGQCGFAPANARMLLDHLKKGGDCALSHLQAVVNPLVQVMDSVVQESWGKDQGLPNIPSYQYERQAFRRVSAEIFRLFDYVSDHLEAVSRPDSLGPLSGLRMAQNRLMSVMIGDDPAMTAPVQHHKAIVEEGKEMFAATNCRMSIAFLLS